jgi:hypothetical protein
MKMTFHTWEAMAKRHLWYRDEVLRASGPKDGSISARTQRSCSMSLHWPNAWNAISNESTDTCSAA